MQLQVKKPKNGRNSVFRGKQTTSKVLSNLFRGIEDGKMVRFLF